MRKIILSVAAILAFGFANAQEKTEGTGGFTKGSWLVSGSMYSNSEKTGDDESSGFGFAPKVGFFVTEKIAVGGKFIYSSEDKYTAGSLTMDKVGLGFGVFGRYYELPGSQFSPFIEVGVDYMSLDNKMSNNKENELGLGFGLGISYFVADNIALDILVTPIKYTSNDNGGNGADPTTSLDANINFSSVSLGLTLKF